MKLRFTSRLLGALVLVLTLGTQAFSSDYSVDHPRGNKNPQNQKIEKQKPPQQQQQQGAHTGKYPLGPDPEITPGKLCDHPSTKRYPENINYCERNVDTTTKKEVIAMYDSELGFTVQKMERSLFKIDHYFPLCAGGSNDPENLWPQHESVYKITDPLEPAVCEKMAAGRLKQADAIKLIIEAKTHLEKAPDIIAYVRAL